MLFWYRLIPLPLDSPILIWYSLEVNQRETHGPQPQMEQSHAMGQ